MGSFFANFKKHSQEERAKKMALVEKVRQFSDLSDREKARLADTLLLRQFSTQEIIYPEASPAPALYFVITGSVGLFRTTDDGYEERLRYVGPGRCFGYSALLEDTPRAATARALEDSSLIALLRVDFLTLLRDHPAMANKILIALTKELYHDFLETQNEFLELTAKLTKSNILV